MKQRPILFNTEMVKAVLRGDKTQTRRVLKTQPPNDYVLGAFTVSKSERHSDGDTGYYFYHSPAGTYWPECTSDYWCPYGQVGDQLWVRETFGDKVRQIGDGSSHVSIAYKATEPDCIYAHAADGKHIKTKWKPSRFMPRWASRITLEITNIRLERLLSITEEDAKAEGVIQLPDGRYHNYFAEIGYKFSEYFGWSSMQSATSSFWTLWEAINGKDSWNANPWVWVIEFKRINQ